MELEELVQRLDRFIREREALDGTFPDLQGELAAVHALPRAERTIAAYEMIGRLINRVSVERDQSVSLIAVCTELAVRLQTEIAKRAGNDPPSA